MGMHWLVYNRCVKWNIQDQNSVFLFRDALVSFPPVVKPSSLMFATVSASQAVSRRTLSLGFCCRSLAASVRLQLCPEPEFWAPLALMAVAVPKMTSGGAVRIRIRCGELGTTKWKEGVFEIHERDNKINLLVKFNSGGTPRMFQVLICLCINSRKPDIW